MFPEKSSEYFRRSLRRAFPVLPAMLLTVPLPPPSPPLHGETGKPVPETRPAGVLPALEEAKTRARLLHASLSGALSVMHRDFFRKNESRAIPSESLEDVFKVMEKDWGLSLRWLAGDATVMNVDHKATDAFQKAALLKITAGEPEVITVEKGRMRFAGAIVLQNECLKCHVQERASLEDRFAALEISMPIQSPPPPETP
ncbi:MAG: DUF3365 domain-containing protein [Verrucomicrobiota bacterium]